MNVNPGWDACHAVKMQSVSRVPRSVSYLYENNRYCKMPQALMAYLYSIRARRVPRQWLHLYCNWPR
jgi:hypothetical protein